MSRAVRLPSLTLLALVAGCTAGTEPDGSAGQSPTLPNARVAPGPPARIETYASRPYFPLGIPSTTDILVAVSDSNGTWLSGYKVSFFVDSGGGKIESLPKPDTTQIRYYLPAVWRLGDSVRRQVAHVEVAGLRSHDIVVQGGVGKLTLLSGGGQRARPGAAVPDPIVVKAAMGDGRPLGAGFPVIFRQLDTLGQFKATHFVLTNDDGLATQEEPWILETRPGPNTMQVRSEAPEVSILVGAVGVLPKPERIAVLSGDGQLGHTGGFVAERPVVVVVDSAGVPMSGQPVAFRAIPPRGATRPFPDQVTDSLGQAAVPTWRLGWGAGLNRLEVTTPGLPPAPLELTATADTLPTPAFRIELAFDGIVYLPLAPAFTQAARAWERIIVGDLPDERVTAPADPAGCYPALDRVVDDVLLFVGVAPIDGPGGAVAVGRVCRTRASGMPIVGRVTLDYDDLLAIDDGAGFDVVATHMMGHALGFGATKGRYGQLVDTLALAYRGASAVAAGNWLAWSPTSRGQPRAWLPLGDGYDPATAVHWADALAPDVMAGAVTSWSQISVLTAAALRDLGYVVDDTRAIEWGLSLPPLPARSSGSALRLVERR